MAPERSLPFPAPREHLPAGRGAAGGAGHSAGPAERRRDASSSGSSERRAYPFPSRSFPQKVPGAASVSGPLEVPAVANVSLPQEVLGMANVSVRPRSGERYRPPAGARVSVPRAAPAAS